MRIVADYGIVETCVNDCHHDLTEGESHSVNWLIEHQRRKHYHDRMCTRDRLVWPHSV